MPLLLLLALLLMTACGPGADVSTGREAYLAYGCAACHGVDGNGNGPAAALSAFPPRDLRDRDSFSGSKTVEGMASTIAFGIADGRTGMPAYPDIPKRERMAMAEYILSLEPPPPGIAIERAWAGESNPAWNIAAAYFELANRTDAPIALVGATSPAARVVEIHETSRSADGVMSMKQVDRVVAEARQRVRLGPGGTHLMLIDVNRELRSGDQVELDLTFSDRSTRKVVARVQAGTREQPSTEVATAAAAAVAASTSDLTLVDQHGRPFRFSSLRGKRALLFFGYTHCPDACPTLLSKISRAYREAGADAREIPTLFVSVDPRDTPVVLDRYLEYFKAVPAIGLTGSKAQLDAVVARFGARYEIRDSGSAAGPLVDHTLKIYLLNRAGAVEQSFDPGASASQLAKAMVND
ncbi:MAG TPA: SCO family protein [Thermoanaerobaculia bacterium]|nr:SCO family protein [Thermoanaerobaculia bacterium]